MLNDLTNEVIQEMVRKENIEIEKEFHSGTSGARVLLFRKNRERYVMKLPTSVNSLRAITSTISAYVDVKREEFDDVLPGFFQIRAHNGIPYLVMSYLGDDFQTCLGKSKNPKKLYDTLSERLLELYARTRARDVGENSFASMLEEKTLYKYELLVHEGLAIKEALEDVRALAISKEGHKITCFAPYSFTPEDIFLTKSGVVFPDLISQYRGLPEISLACFAGVIRDVRKLPNAEYGYEALENLAKYAAHDLMEYPRDTFLNYKVSAIDMYGSYGTIIFLYGRALESARSALFQIKVGDREKAQEFATNGAAYIRKCRTISDFM